MLIGVLLSLPILSLAGATAGQTALLATAAHTVGAWFAILFAYWNGHYFVTGAAIAYALALLLLIPLIFIAMKRIEEIANIAFGRKPRRLIVVRRRSRRSMPFGAEGFDPHPGLSRAAGDAQADARCGGAARLPELRVHRRHQQHAGPGAVASDRGALQDARRRASSSCARTALSGFKAGALRLALTRTAADAEIIGVLDADYVVHPDWLKDLVPMFADAKVGMIQAPQDHRDDKRSAMHHAMNGEYAGFFDIGMVQRNEKNAIIAHGTMCLIRRSALLAAGNWSSDTICEDTDLGLTILELGFAAHYTNRRYGYGLLPDSYLAYKRQRDRWAYGGFQIMKKHWRRFLPGRSLLTREQKREFALGWLSWLGAESVGVLVALLNLIWVPFVAIVGIAIPGQDSDDPDPRGLRGRGPALRLALSAAGAHSRQARCSARCLPPWACNGLSRARSASA